MAAQLQKCKICGLQLAEVLMLRVDDPQSSEGYSWVCRGHNVPDPKARKRQRRG